MGSGVHMSKAEVTVAWRRLVFRTADPHPHPSLLYHPLQPKLPDTGRDSSLFGHSWQTGHKLQSSITGLAAGSVPP